MPQKKMYQDRAKRKNNEKTSDFAYRRLSELNYKIFMNHPKVKTKEQAIKMAEIYLRTGKIKK